MIFKKVIIFGYTSSTQITQEFLEVVQTPHNLELPSSSLLKFAETIVWVGMFWEVYAPLKPLHLKVSNNCFSQSPMKFNVDTPKSSRRI